MLTTGSSAPDFSLPDQDGEPFELARALQAGRVMLYFYPADFTPGCTAEACGIRDRFPDISATDLQVVGVSPQDPDSHKRFAEHHGLPFRLLSDADKSVIMLYDCDGPLGFGVRRGTYIIERDGTISDSVLADIRVSRHMALLERQLRRAAQERE